MAVIVCPICATRYRVADSQLSQASRLKCKKCKTVFPVSDNIKTETEGFAQQTESSRPLPAETGATEPATSKETLEFRFNETRPDAGASADESLPPTLDFSFSPQAPEEQLEEQTSDSVEIQDHIVDTSQAGKGQLEVGLGNLSLEGGEDQGESTLSMDHNLDFSFSAAVPETGPEDEEGYSEEEAGEGEVPGGMNLPLGESDFGGVPDDATMTMEGGGGLDLDLPQGGFQDIAAEGEMEAPVADEGYADEEPLATCCIDSLAMGLTTCEICGRNLEGRATDTLIQQRREQLRDELPPGEIQIGFSEETEAGSTAAAEDEDFSDVEQALDALADGSFEKKIKKREARKHRAQRLKMIGAGIAVVALILGGVIFSLLPKPEQKLEGRYQDLLNQPEMAPEAVAQLFLDAAKRQYEPIVQKVSVMSMPTNIIGGTVDTVGEEYDETSLGQLGQDLKTLREELAQLEQDHQMAEKEWQDATDLVNLSPDMIQSNIKQLETKLQALREEFAEAEAESAKKITSLQQQIAEANRELDKNERQAEEHIYDTDPTGKAMYTAAKRNINALTEKIAELQEQLAREKPEHAQRMEGITADYQPRITEVERDLEDQKALYEKAVLYKDGQKSPVIVLDKKIKSIKAAIEEKKQLVEEKEQQLNRALDFFKRQNQRQQVEQHQDSAEFVSVSKNVSASIKFQSGSKQNVPIVLKRYRANTGEQTIQGDWVVDTILQ